MLQFIPIIASIIRESSVGKTEIKGVSQTVGEALTNKTNLTSMPFFAYGVTLFTQDPTSGVALGLIFGSMVVMTLRDTLAKLIKLYEVKNKANV